MTANEITERKAPSMLDIPEGGLPAVNEAKPVAQTETSRPPAVVSQETVRNIALAITKVAAEVGVIEKRGKNNFHNYKFAQMGDILEKLSPLMAKHGLAVLQSEMRRSMFDDNRVIAIEYGFTLIHTSGEIWPKELISSGMSRCRDSKGGFDDKSMNKCHTSARKYYLLSLFQIATGDEDDADLDENLKEPTRPVQKATAPPHDAKTGEIIDDAIPEDEWGVHQDSPPQAKTGAAKGETQHERLFRLDVLLKAEAENGLEALSAVWKTIAPADQKYLNDVLRNHYKPRAQAVTDAANLL